MADCIREITYRCDDDCNMGDSCKGHKGILNFQSVSEFYQFNLRGTDHSFTREEMQAVVDLIASLDRYDIIDFPLNKK